LLLEVASIAERFSKKLLQQGSDEALALQKKFKYFCTISLARLSYIIVFAFTYVLENLALLYGDFGMNT
jgi:hypothetical protein